MREEKYTDMSLTDEQASLLGFKSLSTPEQYIQVKDVRYTLDEFNRIGELLLGRNLTDDQQVVLEWLKREHFDSYIKSVLSNLYFYVNMTAIGDLENNEIQEMVNAYEKLSQEDFAQVLKVFSQWALEQEGEG